MFKVLHVRFENLVIGFSIGQSIFFVFLGVNYDGSAGCIMVYRKFEAENFT